MGVASRDPQRSVTVRDEELVANSPDAGVRGGSNWRSMLQAFLEHRLAVIGVGIVLFVIAFCFLGPLVYHTNQVQTDLAQAHQPPGHGHPLGTDAAGYDVLGRLMVAGQTSLEVGLAAAVLASMLGTAWGAVSGFVGGWVDGLMMRIVDSFLAIPPLLLVILIASIYGPTKLVLIVVIALVSWLGTARIVRGESLSLRVREYVQAAKLSGVRNFWIVLRHIVPNVIGSIVVLTTFAVADSILLLSALGYLGLGPSPPAADWGGMLTDGLNYAYDGYWWLIYPAGVAIVVTVVAFNFIGDSLRDAFDVRLRRR
jgi:peptide/nickel transport system permease protein